jgi:GNAT superfamily N-acetyltransferase
MRAVTQQRLSNSDSVWLPTRALFPFSISSSRRLKHAVTASKVFVVRTHCSASLHVRSTASSSSVIGGENVRQGMSNSEKSMKPIVHLLNGLRADSGELKRLRSGLLTMWEASRWGGPLSAVPGLAFPPGPESIDRIRSEGKTVKVYALEVDEVVVGGLVLHLGESIGKYAEAVKAQLTQLGATEPAFIRSLVVLPSERGKKYGSLLLNEALLQAESFGATAVGAHAMSEPVRNEWIRRAYKNAGFLSAKEVSDYKVEVPKGGDWEASNREEHIPHLINVQYEAFIAPVPGYVLHRRGGTLRLSAS